MLKLPENAIITRITPRVSETDGCGHINNTVMPVWFEAGRLDIFRAFTPGLGFNAWRVAVVSMRVEYRAQTYLGTDVDIYTWVSKIGTKSLNVSEAAIQDGRLCAAGECIYVNFDYEKNCSFPIPDTVRERLKPHFSEQKIDEIR